MRIKELAMRKKGRILLAIMAIILVLFVARFSRIINPVDQVIITISDSADTIRAVTRNGDLIPVKKDSINGLIRINNDDPNGRGGIEINVSKEGFASLKKGSPNSLSILEMDDISLKPKGFRSFVISNNKTPFRFGIIEAAFCLSWIFWYSLHHKRKKPMRWATSAANAIKTVLKPIDFFIFGVIALAASMNPMGFDIEIIAKCVTHSNEGIDIYATQIAKKYSDNFPWPAYPYPPITLTIMSPIQWVNDNMYAPVMTLLFGRAPSSAAFELISVLVFYAINIFIITDLSSAGIIKPKEVRKIFYLTTLCPGPLYLIAGFQQADILGVLFICLGLLIFRPNRDRLIGSILISIGLSIKPQNLIIAPIIFLFLAQSTATADKQELRENGFFFALIVLLYCLNFYLSQSQSYTTLLSGFSIIERLMLSLWDIRTDIKVYSAPLFACVTTTLIIGLWRPSTSENWKACANAMLAISALICSYQASIEHTPGLSMFMVLGITVAIAISESIIKSIWIMIMSLFAVSFWPFTLPGDMTRPFTNLGLNALLSGFPEANHDKWFSSLYTIEFTGLISLSIIMLVSIVNVCSYTSKTNTTDTPTHEN